MSTGPTQPRKEVKVNKSGQYYIDIDPAAVVGTYEDFGDELLFDSESSTLIWTMEKNIDYLLATYNGQLGFNNELNESLTLFGDYELSFVEEEIEDSVFEEYYTVNFRGCEGEIIGQAWPTSGEMVSAPIGYVYETLELENITFSKDVSPINCSGGFIIPVTGSRK